MLDSSLYQIVKAANFYNLTTLEITPEITETITSNTTIQIISYVSASSSAQAKSLVVIVIEPFATTMIGNYSRQYSFYPADGLAIYPVLFYPECPTLYGPYSVPATTNLGCNLYDAKGLLVKALPNCSIKPNET